MTTRLVIIIPRTVFCVQGQLRTNRLRRILPCSSSLANSNYQERRKMLCSDRWHSRRNRTEPLDEWTWAHVDLTRICITNNTRRVHMFGQWTWDLTNVNIQLQKRRDCQGKLWFGGHIGFDVTETKWPISDCIILLPLTQLNEFPGIRQIYLLLPCSNVNWIFSLWIYRCNQSQLCSARTMQRTRRRHWWRQFCSDHTFSPYSLFLQAWQSSFHSLSFWTSWQRHCPKYPMPFPC